MKSLFSLLFASGWVAALCNATEHNLTFGLINGGSVFFDPVRLGWEDKCKEVGVTCHYRTTANLDTEDCNCGCVREILVNEFLSMENVTFDGIAMKPCDDHARLIPLINNLVDAGIPVVTLDSDSPGSRRAAYVGTDNVFLGRTMARLLRQLRPEGGTFAMIGSKVGRDDGFLEEITKYNDRADRAHWYPVERNFAVADTVDHMDTMQRDALRNPSAIITMSQSPMRHPNWTDFVDANRFRNITYIGTDGADYQLSYLDRRYVDGLIGQLPYEMGQVSLQVLVDIAMNGGPLKETVFPTNIVAYNLIPIELPLLDVDQNLLGNLKYVGFTFFAVVALSAMACGAWAFLHRTTLVVRAAQPFFLIMVAGGVLLMSSSLVPLSYDDMGDPDSMSITRSVGVCMSIPWLAFIGFTVTFSALFSKTWRVNRIFHAKVRHARIQVSEMDVLAPFAVLLGSNIVVLVCWTVLDPLTYVRQEDAGTDYWNRVISTYGACRSDSVVPYLVSLAFINLSVVGTACWQAFQARDIESEFSEAKYIGLAVASMFQAFLTGIPVVVVVRDWPQAFYLVLSLMIFLLCMAILLLIFLPKILLERSYSGTSDVEQNRMFRNSIRQNSLQFRNSKESDLSSRDFRLPTTPEEKSTGVATTAANSAEELRLATTSKVPNEEKGTASTDTSSTPALSVLNE